MPFGADSSVDLLPENQSCRLPLAPPGMKMVWFCSNNSVAVSIFGQSSRPVDGVKSPAKATGWGPVGGKSEGKTLSWDLRSLLLGRGEIRFR